MSKATMKLPRPIHTPEVEEKAFWLLVIAISLAFAWIIWPFFGAVLWGTVLAILFKPLYRRLFAAMRQRRALAALATLAIILVMVILPLLMITALLLQESLGVYGRIKSGELNIGAILQQFYGGLPTWATQVMDRFGLTNVASIQEKLSDSLAQGIQFVAAQILGIGRNTFDFILSFFIMVYLLFFLLRDGDPLRERIRDAIPLRADVQRDLFTKFATVIRATVKGGILVAIMQGALGGLIFWFLDVHAPVLWGVVMAFLSLLPAVGAALVWLPVAVYFLVTGSIWQGIVLIAFGVLVIGLVDNIARPILVGREARMPDYVVLISTLGGIAIFGINGFVIGPVIAAMFMAAWAMVAASRAETRDRGKNEGT